MGAGSVMGFTPLPDGDENIVYAVALRRHELEEAERLEYVRLAWAKMGVGAPDGCDHEWQQFHDGTAAFVCSGCDHAISPDAYSAAIADASAEARAWFDENFEQERAEHVEAHQRMRVYLVRIHQAAGGQAE